jgi:GNAT superfamily N-acetyltransferase
LARSATVPAPVPRLLWEDFEPSSMYGYVRARQLDGTYDCNPETGVWAVSTLRVVRGWGCPSEDQWPYEMWPPTEPPGIDTMAKAHRIFAYHRIRSIDDCKYSLAIRRESVVASFEIVQDAWSTPHYGVIPMTPPNATPDASHCVALVGYNDRRKQLKFMNSWGPDWGDRGFGYLSYDDFDHWLIDAWVTPNVGRFGPPRRGTGIIEENWGMVDPGLGSTTHGFEFFDCANDECIGWSFVIERDGHADIEELFVRPSYRGMGFGRSLANMIGTSTKLAGKSLRLWGCYGDHEPSSDIAVARTLARLGLTARSTEHRWTTYVAT